MRTSKTKRIQIIILFAVVLVCIGAIVYGWIFHARPFMNNLLGRAETSAVEEETLLVSFLNDVEHPFLLAMTNLPRNTSKAEEDNSITISQRLGDETFIVTKLQWVEGTLFFGEEEIFLTTVSDVPYAFLLMQNPEQRILQFNRERTRREIFENLRNQNVMTGLYLSSQTEVDNLVIETILEGFTLVSFYATDQWLYALFTFGAEDKLIWWDGSHLTLAGNFRR